MPRRTLVLLIVSVAVVGVVALALLFKPWLLFVNVEVNDALPSVPSVTVTVDPVAPETTATAEPVATVLAEGTFVSHEHETTGTARIIQNPDGTRVLALENLSTSNGPDVHVWLSAADIVEGPDGWFTAGATTYVDLGALKGNLGNQVYDIPAEVSLSDYRSVSLWCVQFSVSFGAAQLL